MPANDRDSTALYVGDSDTFCADFRGLDVVDQGGELTSPTVTVYPADGLAAGTPTVNDADFESARVGSPHVIPAGKGVKYTLTATIAGTYYVTARATIGGTASRGVVGVVHVSSPNSP